MKQFSTGELVMLAHALRMVPDNAVTNIGGGHPAWRERGPIYIATSDEFKAIWNALAEELNARPDGAEYGVVRPKRKRKAKA